MFTINPVRLFGNLLLFIFKLIQLLLTLFTPGLLFTLYYALSDVYLSSLINDYVFYTVIPIILFLLLIVVVYSLGNEVKYHAKLFNTFCFVLGVFHYLVWVRKYFPLKLASIFEKYKSVGSFTLSLIWELAFLGSLAAVGAFSLIKDILQGNPMVAFNFFSLYLSMLV